MVRVGREFGGRALFGVEDKMGNRKERGSGMTYHINSEMRKIVSPIVLHTANGDMSFSSGEELCEYGFERWYIVSSIRARNGVIELDVEENSSSPPDNWCGDEAVSFF